MKDLILKQIVMFKVLLLVAIVPQTSFASKSGMRATLLAGGSSCSLNKHGQIFFPAETFRTDSFKAQGNNINFASGVGMSYETIVDSNQDNFWNIFQSISVGVKGYYNDNFRSRGSVYEYSLEDFNNSTYKMNVKSFRLMLDTEWALHPLSFGIMPFIEAGVGGAQNTMSFQNIPRPNIGADGGNYKLSHNALTQFAYELGAGLKIPLSNHFIVSARYLFIDQGKAESDLIDPETAVLLASPIKTNVPSQSVLFSLSYLFG